MDFRPTRNTLIINYLVTFSIVGIIVYLSVRNPTTYYYSPEYTSHGGYGLDAAQSCRQCHVQPFKVFEEKTCWTGGCHSNFDPTRKFVATEMLQLNKSESSGEERTDYGSILAFHKALQGNVTCAQCHPSHKLPQTGVFNSTTLARDLKEKLEKNAAQGCLTGGIKSRTRIPFPPESRTVYRESLVQRLPPRR